MNATDHPLVWITGAGGLIGNRLVQSASQSVPEWQVAGLTRQQIDLTDYRSVARLFHEQSPQCIIHCAALSRSPDCEADPAQARIQNVEVTRCLSELAADIPFLLFSTDLVFDGRHGNYRETAPVNPLNVYAETKVEAEHVVLANPRHTVVRTSLNGGRSPKGNRGFNEVLRRAWEKNQTTKLFTDEFRCPIPAVITAKAVWELITRNRPGLYHLAGAERLSRCRIGQLLAARWPHLQSRIQPVSLNDYQGPPRAPDTSLNCAKIQQLLSFPLPGLTAWLNQHPNEPF